MKNIYRFPFTPSELGTLGVEMEWFLIHAEDCEQAPLAEELIRRCGHPKHVKPELFTSIVELNTDIHQDTTACLMELSNWVRLTRQHLAHLNAQLLGMGTHPYSHWRNQEVGADPRYYRLVHRLQWMARRFNICGIHVHVGMPDGDGCIRTMNSLLPIMPAFLALSANSPYWHGDDTGLASTRIKIFEGLSQGGMPFYFQNWQDFEHCASRLMASGSIDSVRDIWWEMRPHPDFGTLEIRIGDMPVSREDTAAYIAYVRAEALAAFWGHGAPRVHPSLIRENRWRACRYGVHMEWIDPFTEEKVWFLDWLERRLDELARHAIPETELMHVKHMLPTWRQSGSGAHRQRHAFLATDGMPEMIAYMIKQDGWPQ
ncbi:MAG: YbdK family carboxylate-amine ligase [Zetaproteobacteria bacterium]|nr:MAG: YbdK family carboxylate-amine ligase [Zetaproteobacteria bacterium]